MEKLQAWINQINPEEKPAYVFDVDMINARIGWMREKLGKLNSVVGLCYAMKANPFLVEKVADFVDRIEVCSPGEYEICLAKNIDLGKIIVSGVNKTYASMERIVSASEGRGIYTIESPVHFEILDQVAKKQNVDLKVLIRLSSGNQFGVDEMTLCQLVERVAKSEKLQLVGVHYYSGTQKKVKKIEKELHKLQVLQAKLREEYKLDNIELEYGPSFMSSYFQGEADMDEAQFDELVQILQASENESFGFNHITLEMGRFLASTCGYYLTKIVDIKKTEETEYVIVDGGIHQLNYYGQMLGMKIPHFSQWRASGEYVNPKAFEDKDRQGCYICGSLCSVNDVIVRDLGLYNPQINDTIILERCGAYSVTEGIALFLSRELPTVYVWQEETGLEKVRQLKETYLINC